MSTSLYALITLDELKLFPPFASIADSEDAALEALIDAATLDFEEYWQNYGVQRSGISERVTWKQIERDGGDVIWLGKYPIVSVTSITDPAGNTIDADDYWIDYDMGALRTTGSWTIPQDSNGFATYWTVVYTAGHVANTAAVPENIKTACKQWVSQLYHKPDPELASKSVGDLSLSYRQGEGHGQGLLPAIKARISAWKKRDV